MQREWRSAHRELEMRNERLSSGTTTGEQCCERNESFGRKLALGFSQLTPPSRSSDPGQFGFVPEVQNRLVRLWVNSVSGRVDLTTERTELAGTRDSEDHRCMSSCVWGLCICMYSPGVRTEHLHGLRPEIPARDLFSGGGKPHTALPRKFA
jgi:hypothetical protein